MINGYEVSDIQDPVDCKWIMGNTSILVQDNPLESQFIVYSAMTGNPIVKHTPDCHLGLGIRNLSISPNAKMIACGLYDSNLVIYNNLTQAQICELDHLPSITIDSKSKQPDIFKEELCRSEGGQVIMSQANNNQLGYQYMNISVQQPTKEDKTLHTIKIP